MPPYNGVIRLDEPNPYEAPLAVASGPPLTRPTRPRGGGRLLLGWAVVFSCNMIVPLLFGWDLTRDAGRGGLFAAGALLLGGGLWLCRAWPTLGGPLVAGAVLVSLTQLLPILQIIAGLMGLRLARAFGQAVSLGEFDFDRITGGLGGFVATLVTGGLLIGVSAAIGLFLRLVTPARWWVRASAIDDT